MQLRAYDTQRFDFAARMRDLLEVDDLTKLQSDAAPLEGASLYKNMEQAGLYTHLLERAAGPAGNAFHALYRDFIGQIVAPQFKEPIIFQARPTIRLVFANLVGEPRFHRDSDYGHDPAEVNFIVPLTDSKASGTVWVESEPGRLDHRPVDMDYGQFLEFDGASLSHGAIVNTTGRSRVSFDFRIVMAAKAGAMHRLSDSLPETPDPHVYNVVS